MFRIFMVFWCLSASVFAESIFIGIAGGTGSGKTTLAQKIHRAFPKAVVISQDSYYKDRSYLPFEDRGSINFDHPDSLEFDLLRDHLIDLKNGFSIGQPTYNFHLHAREKEKKQIDPANIVLVEGILLLAVPEIRDLFDIKIFVDTDEDIRALRRIDRDIKERGRDFNGVVEQYVKTVKPMHDAFVEPSKKHADIIIPGENHTEVALNLILAKLRESQ